MSHSDDATDSLSRLYNQDGVDTSFTYPYSMAWGGKVPSSNTVMLSEGEWNDVKVERRFSQFNEGRRISFYLDCGYFDTSARTPLAVKPNDSMARNSIAAFTIIAGLLSEDIEKCTADGATTDEKSIEAALLPMKTVVSTKFNHSDDMTTQKDLYIFDITDEDMNPELWIKKYNRKMKKSDGFKLIESPEFKTLHGRVERLKSDGDVEAMKYFKKMTGYKEGFFNCMGSLDNTRFTIVDDLPLLEHPMRVENPVTMERVIMTETLVYERHCLEGGTESQVPELERPLGIFVEFIVNDPRISLVNGIRRYISEASASTAADKKKQPKRGLNGSAHVKMANGVTRIKDDAAEGEQMFSVMPSAMLVDVGVWNEMMRCLGPTTAIDARVAACMRDFDACLKEGGALDPFSSMKSVGYEHSLNKLDKDLRLKCGSVSKANVVSNHPVFVYGSKYSAVEGDVKYKVLIDEGGYESDDSNAVTFTTKTVPEETRSYICVHNHPSVTSRVPSIAIYPRVYLNLLFPWINDMRVTRIGGVFSKVRSMRVADNVRAKWMMARNVGLPMELSAFKRSTFDIISGVTKTCLEGHGINRYRYHAERLRSRGDTISAQSSTSPNIQKSMKSIFAYTETMAMVAEKNGSVFTVFPRAENTLENVESPYSQMVDDIYNTAENVFKCDINHNLLYITLTASMNQYLHGNNNQLFSFVFGDQQIGKSHITNEVVPGLLIAGTYQCITNKSNRSNTVGGANDILVIFYDEIPDVFTKKFDKTGDSETKQSISSGQVIRMVVRILSSGAQENVEQVTFHRNTYFILSNKKAPEIPDPLLGRSLMIYPIVVQRMDEVTIKDTNTTSPEYINFKRRFSARQIVHSYSGLHIHTNAVKYDEHNIAIFEVLCRRFSIAMRNTYGTKLHNRDKKRVLHLSKIIMKDRIFAETCRGYNVKVGLVPDMKFTPKSMDALEPITFMKVEDVIQAFAICIDNILQSWHIDLARLFSSFTHLDDVDSETIFRTEYNHSTEKLDVDEKWLNLSAANLMPIHKSYSDIKAVMVKKLLTNLNSDPRCTELSIKTALTDIMASGNFMIRQESIKAKKREYHWFVKTEWVKNKLAQELEEEYCLPSLTTSNSVLDLLRCICFEGICKKKTLILGGLCKARGVADLNGRAIPMPHVCETLVIGSPSEVPEIAAALDKTGKLDRKAMSYKLYEKRKYNNGIERCEKLVEVRVEPGGKCYERRLFEEYIMELYADGYVGIPKTTLIEYLDDVYETYRIPMEGARTYPDYVVQRTLDSIDELNSAETNHIGVDDDEYKFIEKRQKLVA